VDREELAAWLRLTLSEGVGNDSARRLLAAFGLPQAIFSQTLQALEQVVSPQKAADLTVEPEGPSRPGGDHLGLAAGRG
jgi:DNA processing protein